MPRLHKRKRRRNNGLGKVKRDIKWLKQNVEFKFHDVAGTVTELDSTGSITPLNVIAGGSTDNTRVGSMITARRILILGHVTNNNGTEADTVCRLVLVRDRYPQSVAPTIADIFNSAGSNLVNQLRNMELKERFKIMLDYRFGMDTLGHSIIPFKILFKLSHVVKYTDESADDPETNGLYLIGLSTVPAGANNPTMAFDSRYSYCDS